MLYQLHEFQKALLQPMSSWARAASEALINAANPASKVPGSERLAASYELLYRLGKNYKKPEFGIRSVIAHGHEVAIHEMVKVAKPFCNLIRFKRFSDDVETIKKLKDDPSVLIVAPLSGHHATLLRDTVRTLLQDHKVYITDWVDARNVPVDQGEFGLDDYVHYIQEFIRTIGAKAPSTIMDILELSTIGEITATDADERLRIVGENQEYMIDRYKELFDIATEMTDQDIANFAADRIRAHAKFKWMIEEFRVSLFAQELKTAMPVSTKRLTEQLEKARKEAG